jgi:hypothetical protein
MAWSDLYDLYQQLGGLSRGRIPDIQGTAEDIGGMAMDNPPVQAALSTFRNLPMENMGAGVGGLLSRTADVTGSTPGRIAGGTLPYLNPWTSAATMAQQAAPSVQEAWRNPSAGNILNAGVRTAMIPPYMMMAPRAMGAVRGLLGSRAPTAAEEWADRAAFMNQMQSPSDEGLNQEVGENLQQLSARRAGTIYTPNLPEDGEFYMRKGQATIRGTVDPTGDPNGPRVYVHYLSNPSGASPAKLGGLLRDVGKQADARGFNIDMTPVSMRQGDINQKRLEDFYRGIGFKPTGTIDEDGLRLWRRKPYGAPAIVGGLLGAGSLSQAQDAMNQIGPVRNRRFRSGGNGQFVGAGGI